MIQMVQAGQEGRGLHAIGALASGEEKVGFEDRVLIAVRTMNSIHFHRFRVFLPDRPFLRIGRIGCPDEFPVILDGIFLLKNGRYNGSGGILNPASLIMFRMGPV